MPRHDSTTLKLQKMERKNNVGYIFFFSILSGDGRKKKKNLSNYVRLSSFNNSTKRPMIQYYIFFFPLGKARTLVYFFVVYTKSKLCFVSGPFLFFFLIFYIVCEHELYENVHSNCVAKSFHPFTPRLEISYYDGVLVGGESRESKERQANDERP